MKTTQMLFVIVLFGLAVPSQSRAIPGSACSQDSDCGGGEKCEKGKCARTSPPAGVTPCTNAVKDGYESDIDCGGPCDKCPDGKRCDLGSDCTSGYCGAFNKCGPKPVKQYKSLGESCGTSADCMPPMVCQRGKCANPKHKEGEFCEKDEECASGHCDEFYQGTKQCLVLGGNVAVQPTDKVLWSGHPMDYPGNPKSRDPRTREFTDRCAGGVGADERSLVHGVGR
jgi:hypothetical protein